MAGQRQDYILSEIERLRLFVARLTGSRDGAGLEEALRLAFSLQEKLFPRPAAEFLQLAVDDQIAALRAGESPAGGREKCLTYARLLAETATLYGLRGREDLAAGARQLALQITLTAALEETADGPAAALVRSLHPLVDREQLLPPVRERLELFLARVR
ncbi:MAG: hypothetical protein HYV75_09140 [Opitutae bacterium]|nr:hypothetical protein [Opitutae bacterium]